MAAVCEIEDRLTLNFMLVLEDFKNAFVNVFEAALMDSYSNAKQKKVSDFLKHLPKNERQEIFTSAACQIFNSFSLQIYAATHKKYFYKLDLYALAKTARRRCFQFIYEQLERPEVKFNVTASLIVRAILEGQLATTSENKDSFENAFQIKCPLIYEKTGILKTNEEKKTVEYYCEKRGKNNCSIYGYRQRLDFEYQNDVKFDEILRTKYDLFFICTQRVSKRSNIKVNFKKSADNFTGRMKEIRMLHSMLSANNDNVIPRCVVITGVEGAGKTELARKYFEIYENAFDFNTIWIDCKSEISVRQSFEKFLLFLNEDNFNEFELRELAINSYKFLLKSRSLIVFDDVENADDICSILPPCCVSYSNLFSVLIISSNSKIISRDNNRVKFLFLGCLSNDEACDFAEKLLQRNDLYFSNSSIAKLVQVVTCLPSAIKRAVEIFIKKIKASIYETSDPLELFLDTFERESQRKTKVLDHSLYDKHVEILGQIKNGVHFGENAVKLFEIMAYLGEGHIDVENLVRLATEITGVYNAVDVLYRYSLFYKGHVNCVYKELTRCIVRNEQREKDHLEIILRKPKLFQISDNGNEEVISLWRYVKEYSHLVNSYIYSRICPYSGLTPVHLLTGHIDILKSVLRSVGNDFKINMNEICDNFSRTPLDMAIINGHSSFVRTYFKNDVISIFHSELNAAMCNSKYNDFDSYLLRIDPRIINSEYGGASALHNAVACSNINITKILLKHHIEVNSVNVSGITPLHIACQNGHLGIVKLLISFRADANRKDVAGWTPLFYAASRGHDHLVEYFMIKNLVNGKQTDLYDRTIFHVAVQFGRLNIVEYLLKHCQTINLDINATAMYGNSPIFTAAFNGHWDVFRFLLENNAALANASNQNTLVSKLELNVLHVTTAFNNVSLVKKLVEEYKIDANGGYGVSLTPAFIAEYFENSEICSYLSNMRAKVNINKNNILRIFRNTFEEHERKNDLERIVCTDFLSVFDKRLFSEAFNSSKAHDKWKKLQKLIYLLLDIKRDVVKEIILRRLHISQKLASR